MNEVFLEGTVVSITMVEHAASVKAHCVCQLRVAHRNQKQQMMNELYKHGTTVYTAVTNIQTDLKDAGYTEVGTIDGKYGKNTETAAKNFQKDQGLTVDGLFGNNSKMKLWDVIGSSR